MIIERDKIPKQLLSLVLCIAMVFSMIPTTVFAVTISDTGLCEHHTEHTAECGYVASVVGQSCGHTHEENCYSIVECVHNHDDACGSDGAKCTHMCCVDNGCIAMKLDCQHFHDSACGYSVGTEEIPCGHVHDETCGYAEAVEEALCGCTETDESGTLIHTENCGYVAPAEGAPCSHTEHTDCGYAAATEGTPCTHTHAVIVDSEESCYGLLCSHAEPHYHDETCGYVAAVEGNACTYALSGCADCIAAQETPRQTTEAAAEPTEAPKSAGTSAEHTEVSETTAAAEPAVDEAVENVRDMIAALPTVAELDAMSWDEKQAAYADTQAADAAYQALADDQKAQLVIEKTKLDELFAYFKLLTAPVDAYSIWIGSTQITSDNASDVLGDGTVSYDAAANTLTLKHANIENGMVSIAENTVCCGIYDESPEPLTIELAGENFVSGADSAGMMSFGIVSSGNLELSGSGSLTARGGAAMMNIGIYVMGQLTISNTGGLTAQCDLSERESYSISAAGLTVADGLACTPGGVVHVSGDVTGTLNALTTKNIGSTDLDYRVFGDVILTKDLTVVGDGNNSNSGEESYIIITEGAVLTIPDGVTLTIAAMGEGGLYPNYITNNGTIILEGSGTIVNNGDGVCSENAVHCYRNGVCLVCGHVSEVSVNINWGDMSFTYTDGTWNTETHTYDGAGWEPNTEGGNTVTVANTGTVAVTASVTYENTEGYSFTGTWDEVSAVLTTEEKENTFTLTISGKPTASMDKATIGTVTVKIEGGEDTQ